MVHITVPSEQGEAELQRSVVAGLVAVEDKDNQNLAHIHHIHLLCVP